MLLAQDAGEEEVQALVEDGAAQHAQQPQHAQHSGLVGAPQLVQLTPISSSPPG